MSASKVERERLEAKQYRSQSDIELKILELLEKEGPQTKTKIMYAGYLSYTQLKQYLANLTGNSLIEKKSDLYELTAKGNQYLGVLRKAASLRHSRG